MDIRTPKEDRLKMIKKSAIRLRQKKREGLDLTKNYNLGEVVYSKAQDRFGKITHLDEEFIHVNFGNEEMLFNRFAEEDIAPEVPKKKSRKSSASSSSEKRQRRVVIREIDNDASRFKWTQERDEFIRENLDKSNQWLAEQLSTTVASVKGRTHRLKENGFIPTDQRRNFVWNDERDAYLLEHIEKPNKWLADQLYTSVGSVKGRIRRLRERGEIPRDLRKTDGEE